MNGLRQTLLIVLALAPAVCQRAAWADAGDDQYAVAAEHYRQQRWQLAADEFAALVSRFADHARRDDAEFFLAESQVQLGDFRAAAEHFRVYLDRAPQGRYAKSALFRGGEAAYLGGQGEEAERQLAAFLTAYADDELAAYALPYLGRLALDAKKYDVAEQRFRQALDKFPTGPLAEEAQFGLARTHEHQGDHAAAEEGFAAIAARRDSPIADVAQFRLGLVRYTRGDYAAAEKTFAELVTGFPRSQLVAKSDYWRALSIKSQQRWREAAGLLIAVAEHATGSAAGASTDESFAATARYHAGDALLAAGEAAAAIEQFELVLASRDAGELADDALLAKMQATLIVDPTAVERLAEAWKDHADSPLAKAAQRIRAQALVQQQQYDAAIEQLKPLAVAANSNFANSNDANVKSEQQSAAYLLAVALHGAGKYDEALAQFARLEAVADEPLKSTVQLGRASTLVRLRRYEEARPLLESFLAAAADGPNTATALVELAFCNAGQGQFNDARRRYEAFAKLPVARSTLLSTTHRLAEMAYRGGQRDWAAELFGLLAADGNPSEYVARGLSGQAWCQFSSDDLTGSAATFLRLVEQFPSDPLAAEGALVRGKALERLGEYDPALLMYRTVIDKFPDAAEAPAAVFAAAELHERLKQRSDAESYYRRLLERFPSDAKTDAALYQLAWLLRTNDAAVSSADAARRAAEAETLFERLRHQHKQSAYWADAVFRLAEAARDRQDAAQVAALVDELSAATDAKTDSGEPLVDARTLAHAFYLQGRLAVDAGDWAAAEKAMTTLVERCAKSDLRLAAEFWIAEAAYRRAEYELAATRFEKLAVDAQSTPATWLAMIPLRRAQVLAQQKKWPEAIALAETIAKDFPDFVQQYEADYLIGRALAAQGKFDEARALYAKVTQSPQGGKTETAAMAQWMIGESYFHQQDYATAVKEYLRVEILYAYPKWQAAALVQAGKAYESDGQWQEAIKLYTQVLRKYGETDYAAEASTRLRVVQQRAEADDGSAKTR
ncbi:MAG: tetratricopeptide repeat protein [Pirellulales bacterium]